MRNSVKLWTDYLYEDENLKFYRDVIDTASLDPKFEWNLHHSRREVLGRVAMAVFWEGSYTNILQTSSLKHDRNVSQNDICFKMKIGLSKFET